MARSPALQDLLTLSEQELRAATKGPGATAAQHLGARLAGAAGKTTDRPAERLDVCDWIAPALAAARNGPRAALAAGFAAVEAQLVWQRRVTADPADTAFWNGHANAMILGPGGLEERADIWIGATIMAPNVTYAVHSHPPEEVYLSLAPGEWWNAQMDWTDPGPQGAIHNPPGILHSMRSGAKPFLALWYLPI